MLSTVDVPEILEQQYAANKQLAAEIAEALEGSGRQERLDADVDLLAFEELAYVHIRGPAYFKFYHSDRLLRMFSAGDLVPAGPRFTGSDARIVCDFAADVTIYSPSEVMQTLADKPGLLAQWLQYFEDEQSIIYGLCARYTQVDNQPDIRLKHYQPGDVIISEGEPSTEVLCLIDGLAQVTSHDVVVGEVRPSEFFGEIGFLLNQDRTAAVIAVNACTVQVIDTTEFVEFIKHNPQVIISLATTLAGRIVELNDRVVTADAVSVGRRRHDISR
jgi:hypothetical protein